MYVQKAVLEMASSDYQNYQNYQKLHPETFSATIKKSCRKSIPARRCTSVFTDDKKGGGKLPNFKILPGSNIQARKTLPMLRVQENAVISLRNLCVGL